MMLYLMYEVVSIQQQHHDDRQPDIVFVFILVFSYIRFISFVFFVSCF